MITCKFEHFTRHLRFTTVMRDTLRRGRNILNPRPTLRQKGNEIGIMPNSGKVSILYEFKCTIEIKVEILIPKFLLLVVN